MLNLVNTFVFAAGFDININENEAKLALDFSEQYETQNQYGVSYYFNEDKNRVYSFFYGTSPVGTGESLIARAGIKLSAANLGYINKEAVYASLYGGVGFSLQTSVPSIILINFLYSPDILTFSGIENAYEGSVSYEALITPLFIVYTGYRQYVYSFKSEVEHENFRGTIFKLSNAGFIGIRFKF